jgi:putative ABC transport system ATP-binding protein
MYAIEAFDLYRFYHTGEAETLALRGVSLRVAAGEMVAVMGPSGSGKSTLLACLAGLDEPDGGYVKIAGKRLTRRSETERAALRAKSIGLMLQTGNLFNHLSVVDNIRLAMNLAGKIDDAHLSRLLEMMGLQNRRYSMPGQLSGGEVARVALMIALANKPAILLADEPTGEVDATTETDIINLFESYCNVGGSMLIATHSRILASRASRIIHLTDGRVTDVWNLCYC